MLVDIFKLLFIVFGLIRYGAPDSYETAFSYGLVISTTNYQDFSVALSLKVDLNTIYNLDEIFWLGNEYCGLYFPGVILVSKRAHQLGCSNTLEHEIGHAWQYRTFGPFLPIYGLFENLEPEYPYYQIPPHRKTMNYSLITFYIPLPPYR